MENDISALNNALSEEDWTGAQEIIDDFDYDIDAEDDSGTVDPTLYLTML
jgi:hypothetical protein